MEITQEDCCSKEEPAYRPSRVNRTIISRSTPLIRRLIPTLNVPQDLQDSLGSNIALCIELARLLPEGLQAFILHFCLPPCATNLTDGWDAERKNQHPLVNYRDCDEYCDAATLWITLQ